MFYILSFIIFPCVYNKAVCQSCFAAFMVYMQKVWLQENRRKNSEESDISWCESHFDILLLGFPRTRGSVCARENI